MPTWAILLICVAVLIAVKVFELRRNDKLASEGKLVKRKSDFVKYAEIFTLKAADPAQVTEGLKEMLQNKLITGLKGDPDKQTFSLEGRRLSQWTARLYRIQADGEQCEYRFEFTGWKEEYGKPAEEESMNMALTAVEKLFLQLDPDTQVRTEQMKYHTK